MSSSSATRLVDLRTGVVAAVVLAVLPRVTWAATEGRSAALVLAVAVWLTVALVAAVRADRSRTWVLYGALACVATSLWLLLPLLLAAHLLTLLWWRSPRPVVARQVVASAVGVLVAAPLVVRGLGQSGQVGWIPRPSLRTVRLLVADQYFGTQLVWALPLVVVCGALVVLAVVRHARGSTPQARVVALAVPWLGAPAPSRWCCGRCWGRRSTCPST